MFPLVSIAIIFFNCGNNDTVNSVVDKPSNEKAVTSKLKETKKISHDTSGVQEPTFSNVPPTEVRLLKRTLEIMRILNISPRDKVNDDGPLRFELVTGFTYLQAKFGTKSPYNHLEIQKSYPDPTLQMSSLLHKLLTRQIDTTEVVYIKAFSIVAHEYTHYLQKTPFDALPMENHPDVELSVYYRQPKEFEALAVQGYFFLAESGHRAELDSIMNAKVDKKKRFEMIGNAYFRIAVPHIEKPIFD